MTSGYTVVEAAAAMAVLGLTVIGLAAGVGVLARYIHAANEDARQIQDLRAAALLLERAAGEGAPFRMATLAEAAKEVVVAAA